MQKKPKTKKATSKVKRKVATKNSKIIDGSINSRKPTSHFGNALDNSFPIIGIGASAGGLEAFKEFFSNMVPGPEMSYVLVTHQNPEHHSLLPELISKCTDLEVRVITDRLKAQPNRVYLSPPDKNVSLKNNIFFLSNPHPGNRLHLPIDFFFRSLAEDQKENSICIIFSGTGTDGTLGLRAIKGESGMAIIQEESSAKFSGMPSSAHSTGMVDYVLPASKVSAQLARYVSHLSDSRNASQSIEFLNDEMATKKVFRLLRNRTGNDFSSYKSKTTGRRIKRRMAVHHIQNINDYLHFLQENPEEKDALLKELLISVTSFFRDPGAFDYLGKKLLPGLLKNKKDNSIIRVWVPGCASGEEVYSLAILINESLEKITKRIEIQIFGTDLDLHAINLARTGLYPEGIAADIKPARLKKYFTKEENKYRICKNIREMAIFAQHNVIKDPPFRTLDMISCRNLMIYLNKDLQKRLLSLFYYSLLPEGILFLGNSESIASGDIFFKPVSKNWKIFSPMASDKVPQTSLTNLFPLDDFHSTIRESEIKIKPTTKSIGIQQLATNYLLKTITPASVLVDGRGEISYIHGKTDDFLELPPGEPNHNILSMAREGLKTDLANALHKARDQDKPISVEGVLVKKNDGEISINLSIRKLISPPPLKGLFCVVFQTNKPIPNSIPNKQSTKKTPSTKGDSTRIQKLEKELEFTRNSLQFMIENLEATNEELQSTNEELQSTNEELQSSNEEIETSKEEMQSLNEELQTTNSELQSKIADYYQANNDLNNLLNSTNIATIFLDCNLNIKRFTREAKQIIHLIESDIGRPITDIVSNLDYNKLSSDFMEVLDTLVFKEIEVQTKEGVWYQIRIFPYRTTENKIDGLVATFSNIDKIKRAEQQLKDSTETALLAAIFSNSNDAITVQTMDGKFLEWNPGAEAMYGYSKAEIQKMNVNEITPEECKKEMNAFIKQAIKGKLNKPLKTKRICKNGKILEIYLTATFLEIKGFGQKTFATTEIQIS